LNISISSSPSHPVTGGWVVSSWIISIYSIIQFILFINLLSSFLMTILGFLIPEILLSSEWYSSYSYCFKNELYISFLFTNFLTSYIGLFKLKTFSKFDVSIRYELVCIALSPLIWFFRFYVKLFIRSYISAILW
jgi:hypothetical protein